MINFNDRNQLFRKSDPTYRNKKATDNPSPDDMESISNIKRKGASLARSGFNRQNSFGNSGREYSNKRISVLEPSKSDHGGHSAGGTKLMNFIKSSLNLTKSKSKSKLNLNESKPYIYAQTSSKSEEHLNGLPNDVSYPVVKSRNLVLKMKDNTVYTKEYNNNNEEILKPFMVLNKKCLIQPLHPSIANYYNFCFQIIKRETSEKRNKPFRTDENARNNLHESQIAKSYSYNSSFCSLKAISETDSVSIIRCGSALECSEWTTKLKKHINPNYENTVRHEDLFKIWIQEAKNLIMKKRYFCEIKLDNMLYGRTSVKIMTDMVFWGEEFEFRGLKNINTVSISLYRLVDNKKKHDKSELVAQINIPCSDFTETSFVEKWYSPSPDIKLSSMNLKFSQSSKIDNAQRPDYDEIMKNVIDCSPMLRIKGRYRPLEILPTRFYQPLSDYLVNQSISLVESLESHLKVKSKEDFVKILLLILEYRESHLDFLADLVTMEVLRSDDNLILRGNSIASKAMESFMKMVGEKYLASLLTELINIVIYEEIDCEVDPLRFSSSKELPIITDNQNRLVKLVENVWNKIYKSANSIPKDLKTVFSKIREKLSLTKRVASYSSPTIDQVISSCLFLRFICPAIMSPFLFGLANEYSDKVCINRTFTLVAKSIQSLANFSQFPQSKEGYMGFMQHFINKNSNDMRIFLKSISTTKANGTKSGELNGISNSLSMPETLNIQPKDEPCIDIGYHLAELTFQLNVHLDEIPEKKYTPTLNEVRSLLENISRYPGIGQSESDSGSSDHSNAPNLNSRIPTFQKSAIETRSKIHLSKSTGFRNNSMETHRRFSLPKKKSDVEENFSYIPVRNTHSKTPTGDKRTPFNFDNYVDFEHCESVVYDEPYGNNFSSMKTSVETTCMNEEEINEDWKKMVKECRNITESSPHKAVVEDSNNYTFNSSGYQSLSNFSPDDVENCNLQPPNRSEYYKSDIELAASLPVRVNSPKIIPICQRNIANRFKRNSPNNRIPRASTDVKYSDINTRHSQLVSQNTGSLSYSRETLESLENLCENDNHNLSESKSMFSLYQKNSSITNAIPIPMNHDREASHESSDCSLSSNKNRSMSVSSQLSFSNTISTNIDLDPLISNEWKRIKLLLQLFNVPKPTHYHGTAVEQYKHRTMDENHLVNFIENKSELTQSDIVSYLPAAYRLLKSVYKQGKLSTDVLTNYLLNANQQVQSAYINQHFDAQNNGVLVELNGTKSSGGSKSSKNSKTHRELSNLSTQSLPYPATKCSKQSQISESINKL